MYRRTTIAATATALALLGGGTALAANAGLFGGTAPDGAGTVPAVSTLDGGSGDPATVPADGTGSSAERSVPTQNGDVSGDDHDRTGQEHQDGEHSGAEDDD